MDGLYGGPKLLCGEPQLFYGEPELFYGEPSSFMASLCRPLPDFGRERLLAWCGQRRRGALKKQFAICAALLLLGFGTARLAHAQTVYMSPGAPDLALPPYEIMSIVRSTGLAPLTRPMRRGPYYVLVAVDRVGRQMRVVVDAQLGDIVNLRPALAVGSYGPEPGRPNGLPAVATTSPDAPGTPAAFPATPPAVYGAHPSGEGALLPTPPRPIPNARTVNAPGIVLPPARLAVAEPGLPPPLPRPRPKLALNEAPAAAPAATAPAAPAAASPPAAAPSQPIE
jgi:hypothetical protein